MSESRILAEIEACCAHHKICVLPRNPKKLACSVWVMPDPAYHVGVIWRQNTGGMLKGKQFVRFGLPGTPDFTGWLFKSGIRLSIEAKAVLGVLTPDQLSFASLARFTGTLHGVIRSYEDCDVWLKQIGL